MSKKQDVIRSEQNRDANPESGVAGSASQVSGQERRKANAQAQDAQEPQTGKVSNDHNKMGETRPTQKNEGRRTPESRTDRESQLGSSNQSQSRRGRTGGEQG